MVFLQQLSWIGTWLAAFSARLGDEATYITSFHSKCRAHHSGSGSEDNDRFDQVHVEMR